MDTRRLILLMIFLFSSFLLWQNWQVYKNPPPVPTATNANTGTAAPASVAPTPSGTVADGAPTPSASLAVPSTTVPAVAAETPKAAETFVVETDLYLATFSTQGGDLIGLTLKKYQDQDDKSKNFVYFDPKHAYAAQSGLIGTGLPTHRTHFKRLDGALSLSEGQNQLEVRLRAVDDNSGVEVVRVLTFQRNEYTIASRWEISNRSAQPIAAHAYYQLQRDDVSPSGDMMMASTFTGPAVYTETDKYQKVDFSDIAEGKAKFTKNANNGWLALVQHYFVAAWLPEAGLEREFYMRRLDGTAIYQAGVIVPMPAIAAGSAGTLNTTLYVGPQEQSRLEKAATGLPLVVDYGWLTVIAAPIFWALNAIHQLVGNWGWAIIVLTIIIKLIFYPLSAASYKSMAKMRVVTPRLMQLKERYSDDRTRLNQEMMKLYQTEKINPLGGCLPILVQIPVFIALYWVLLGAVEMRGAPWLGWISDLAAPDPWFILPILMIASMVIQMRLNPTPPDPIQAKVMAAMPFIFGIMFLFFPSGLVLYWVVNNILSIAQQWHITHNLEQAGKPPRAANDEKV